MILLCLIGILLSLGLTFEGDFTHFPEPGIPAAVLHQARLILRRSQSDLRAVAGGPVSCLALQGGKPELVTEESSPRIAGKSGLLERESNDGSLRGLWTLWASANTGLPALFLEASMTLSLRKLPHPLLCHLHEIVSCCLSWEQLPAGKQMDWGSVSSHKLGIRRYLQNHVLLGPGEEWKRVWLRNIWGRERIKYITKGDKAGNPHLTISKWKEKIPPSYI